MPVLDSVGLASERIFALRTFHQEAGIPRAELDLSGGVDSAVMAGLLVQALGPEYVTLAHLGIQTNPYATARARRLADAIGCRLIVSDFSEEYDRIVLRMKRDLVSAGYDEEEVESRIRRDPTILGALRSMLRAPLGRGYNRFTGGGIRHGTGNECEDRWLRFYQKGGDGEVDTNPIAMLSKNEVWQLAWGLGSLYGTDAAKAAFVEVVAATPSPDLWGTGDEHNDESEFHAVCGVPFSYGRTDPETGRVIRIGTIERVSRFLDVPMPLHCSMELGAWELVIFADKHLTEWGPVVEASRCIFPEAQFSEGQVVGFLKAARRMERLTRHKMNPAISTLGTREKLLRDSLLSDDLSQYGCN